MGLSNKLKFYRKSMNLTQQQVADALGIQRCAYAYYESGKSSPKLPVLKMIAKLFNVSIDILLDNDIAVPDVMRLNSDNDYLQKWIPDDKFNQLSDFEQNVLLRIRLMSADDKEKLIDYLNKE